MRQNAPLRPKRTTQTTSHDDSTPQVQKVRNQIISFPRLNSGKILNQSKPSNEDKLLSPITTSTGLELHPNLSREEFLWLPLQINHLSGCHSPSTLQVART